ncbi:DUF2177 family protein [Lactococcus formosensis]|uniref:DUF2177 family protein n=1 Tax=Lactococcus formosensis TaxID=1281486 RepID=UPI002097C19E|nr:DUF2177 family protein [Lactococcus formosensis]MCO7180279.1 DUF2177 family protein [Lactococcus formosensis]
MFQFLKLFLINAVIFLILDSLWLIFANKKFYQPYIGHLMGQTKLLPAIIFYFIYVAALVFFVLVPGQEKESLSYVLLAGVFFGVVCYATYDLTNLATLSDWPLKITIVDIIWGSFVTSLSATLTYIIAAKL